jgi:SAM-dependent methyltransferase
MEKIINTLAFINKHSCRGFIRECYYRGIDNYYEKHFGVQTKGMVSTEELGTADPESQEYCAVNYGHTITMLNKVPLEKSRSTLLDYGCGKGRVIICAASYEYKQIIGVENSVLINIARNNLENMRHRKTRNVVLKHCDARDFVVPADVNIIYFFSPFRGQLLQRVIRNIYSSYRETQRKIYVIYFNNVYFDQVVTNQNWITKIWQSETHLNIPCGLYETPSRQ